MAESELNSEITLQVRSMNLWDDTVVSPQWLTSQQVFRLFVFFAAENDLAALRQLFVLFRLSFTSCKTKRMKRAETTAGGGETD